MKHKHQIRNFFRHARLVGLLSAVLILLYDLLSGSDFYYTDEGGMISRETLWM